jgi:hypothetical protein
MLAGVSGRCRNALVVAAPWSKVGRRAPEPSGHPFALGDQLNDDAPDLHERETRPSLLTGVGDAAVVARAVPACRCACPPGMTAQPRHGDGQHRGPGEAERQLCI